MNPIKLGGQLAQSLAAAAASPSAAARDAATLSARCRGIAMADAWPPSSSIGDPPADPNNPLRAYFDRVSEGPGVWKWIHYIDAYHRHLQRFVGRPVTVVEVGIYSGGSLPMWRQYFGPRCHLHGIDIMPECKEYAGPQTTVHIGDQADRRFWAEFRKQVPVVDVLIDDGGHAPEQQMVTAEEILPHIAPGGVYICEDIHGVQKEFSQFTHALADRLNRFDSRESGVLSSAASPLQSAVDGVHFYPYMAVVELREAAIGRLVCPKHGTQWQPFL